jgi:uncharacterized membrane protein YjdF
VLLGAPILFATAARFPLTPLVYTLIAVHALILILGGHYTYAEVPLGFWVRDALGLARNHYDRLGHFAQGFVPAIVVREVLLRTSPLRRGRWLFFLVTATCLAISACYEFIEWWTALAAARPRTRSSARRATCGTRSGTCSSRSSARSPRSSRSRARTTARSRGSAADERS